MAEIKFNKDAVKKILVVRSDNLGDVINTTPAIEALRRSFPEAYIAALVADYTKEALTGNPYLDRVFSYEKAKHSDSGKLSTWMKQAGVMKEIRNTGFDLAIGIRSRFTKSHAWLVYASGAPQRLGHRPLKGGWPMSNYFNIFAPDEIGYGDNASDGSVEEVHEVERSLNVLRTIGVDIEDKRLNLYIPAEELKEADAFIEAYKLKRKKALICLHLTSRPEHDRFWPVEHYVELIDALQARPDVEVVMNWMAAEEENAARIMNGVKLKPPVFKANGLKGFAAFLSRSDKLITLEGGAMHIGAASGCQTIAIFGNTSTTVWRPWGESNITIKNGSQASMVSARDVYDAVAGTLDGRSDKVVEFRR